MKTLPYSLAAGPIFLITVLYCFRMTAHYYNYLLTCPISLPDWKLLESKEYFLIFVIFPRRYCKNWIDKQLAVLEDQQVEK